MTISIWRYSHLALAIFFLIATSWPLATGNMLALPTR